MTLTYAQALKDARQRLAPLESAGLDAQLLLCLATGDERAAVLAHPERTLTPEAQQRFEQMLSRRAGGEPLAYIRGTMPFYDRELIVTPDVLIPRPETELLLEWALEIARGTPPRIAADIGTGSGALAVTFKAHVPDADVYAVDVSDAALAVAARNADAQGTPIHFLRGDLLTPLAERNIRPDLVMANLPYIRSDEVPRLEVSLHEPALALDGGADGLVLVRHLLDNAAQVCAPRAWLFLEIGADQGQAALALASRVGDATLRQDYAGLDRMIGVRLHKDA